MIIDDFLDKLDVMFGSVVERCLDCNRVIDGLLDCIIDCLLACIWETFELKIVAKFVKLANVVPVIDKISLTSLTVQ